MFLPAEIIDEAPADQSRPGARDCSSSVALILGRDRDSCLESLKKGPSFCFVDRTGLSSSIGSISLVVAVYSTQLECH